MIAVLVVISLITLVMFLLWGAERWDESLDRAIEDAFRDWDDDEDELS